MIESVTTVPGGFRVNGVLCREARLRELTGTDHAFLMEQAGTLLPAQWITEVLLRCVTSLGGAPVSREAIRALTVGDREALLLQLRRMIAGDRLVCVLTCPSEECGEKLDAELSIADLLLPPYQYQAEPFETCNVRFRLPTGEDQEAVADLARTDWNRAADVLLERCVEEAQQLSAAARVQVPARMAELDAQADLTLHFTCSACGSVFTAVFDAASYLFQELQAGMRHLYHEVHLLAFHYHWSLSDILGLSTRTRRQFLRLIEEELAV